MSGRKPNRLQTIIFSEVITPGLIALGALTFVVFTREFGRLAELLIRKDADLLAVLNVIASLLPAILVFTLPFSFLIGVLIGFSRLSADSEIIALRACGVSIVQLIRPVLKLGLLVAAASLLLTMFLLPRGNWSLRQIRDQIGVRPAQSAVKPRVFNEDFPGMVLYVEDQQLSNSQWEGVFMSTGGDRGERRIILSRISYPLISQDSQRLQIHFEEGTIYQVNPLAPEKDSLTRFHTLEVPVDLGGVQDGAHESKRAKDKTLSELWLEVENGDAQTRRLAGIELQRRVALPLSALLFAVLGVTLGVHTPRGGRSYGFLVGLSLAFFYYVLFATGSQLAQNGALPMHLGVWGADYLLAVLGLLSFRYAHGRFELLTFLGNVAVVSSVKDWLRRIADSVLQTLQRAVYRVLQWGAYLRSLRLQPGRVIDFYVVRSFLFYFLLTLCVCTALFYLFTFFDLVDDFFANGVSYSLLFDYFFYLLPHILMLLVPISILIATLITLGLLDKTNQVVALKACGVSVYRVVLPLLVVALTLSGSIFIVQEYVLPYANQRQDSLRNTIKGRPAQTYYQGNRQWIFGQEGQLYNYSYFDFQDAVFADLSIFRLDLKTSRILQYTHARSARWDPLNTTWTLFNGWTRSFEDGREGFQTFQQSASPMTEFPEYFEKEVKESSKMTYLELREYIEGLRSGGFEVDHLTTELHKKVSFPAVNFIMSILGVPFAFSIGRKGALYGIAAGVLLGVIYWGGFGIFTILGANGLLAPILAAWGPNLLFGSLGVFLISGVRT